MRSAMLSQLQKVPSTVMWLRGGPASVSSLPKLGCCRCRGPPQRSGPPRWRTSRLQGLRGQAREAVALGRDAELHGGRRLEADEAGGGLRRSIIILSRSCTVLGRRIPCMARRPHVSLLVGQETVLADCYGSGLIRHLCTCQEPAVPHLSRRDSRRSTVGAAQLGGAADGGGHDVRHDVCAAAASL